MKESIIKENSEPVIVLVQSLLISSLTEGKKTGGWNLSELIKTL